MNIFKTHISELTDAKNTVPLFRILFIEGGGEEYVESKLRVKQDSACCWCKNAIQYQTPRKDGM